MAVEAVTVDNYPVRDERMSQRAQGGLDLPAPGTVVADPQDPANARPEVEPLGAAGRVDPLAPAVGLDNRRGQQRRSEHVLLVGVDRATIVGMGQDAVAHDRHPGPSIGGIGGAPRPERTLKVVALHLDPDRHEPNRVDGASVGVEGERPRQIVRDGVEEIAHGALICPGCQAPIRVGAELGAGEVLACGFCDHRARASEFVVRNVFDTVANEVYLIARLGSR